MKTWATIDKSAWPAGAWNEEPDKAHWIDDQSGFDCLIVRNTTGILCGYVGVPESHPLYRQSYEGIEADLNVHGGLTFSDSCHPDGEEGKHICHPKEGAANEHVWWLGFDCAHYRDAIPSIAGLIPGFTNFTDENAVYRDFGYVKAQVEGLAKQLKEIE